MNKALEESIVYWKQVVADPVGTYINTGSCALCIEYRFGREWETKCVGCIVEKTTGKSGCEGTPYIEFEDMMEMLRLLSYNVDNKQVLVELRELARKELKFLISLREK